MWSVSSGNTFFNAQAVVAFFFHIVSSWLFSPKKERRRKPYGTDDVVSTLDDDSWDVSARYVQLSQCSVFSKSEDVHLIDLLRFQ